MNDQSQWVAQAVVDLAQRTGVDADAVAVISEESVTWRDGSLGCPEPGMLYTQSLVPGYRIILRADGRTAIYHGARGEPPFECENPDPNGSVEAP